MAAVGNYTNVYIWLAKDSEGYTTTSSEGGRLEKKSKQPGPERCGHASMEVFPSGNPSVYMSFWPDVDERTKPAILVESLEKEQSEYEGTLPDVVIRLHQLDINKILATFQAVQKRIDLQQIQWEYQVSSSEDVTNPNTKRASCVTFVYSFLQLGGFNSKTKYYNYVRGRGPTDSHFYSITKCDAGDRVWGIFNGIFWTEWVFSPKALLLRCSSAAEAYHFDKQETIKLMKSNQVAKEKERGWRTTVGTVGVVGAAFLLAYGLSKK